MNRRRTVSLLLSLLLCAGSAWLNAELNTVQLDWLEQQALALHWDNVEGAPVWIDGPVPRYSRKHGLHLVELQPGAAVRMQLPAAEQVRVLQPDAAIRREDVDITWSNGSGLYLSVPARLAADKRSLIADSESASAGIVRISRPANFRDPVTVALFASRQPPRVQAAGYHKVLALPEGLQRVRLAQRTGNHDFWQLEAGRSVQVSVAGATRIKLETHFIFPAEGDVNHQAYRITAWLDGKPWRVMEFETTLDTSYPVAADGCIRPLGHNEAGYLEIPDGQHRLELKTSAPVYLRLLRQQGPDDYLWDGNLPLIQHQSLQGSGPLLSPDSIWTLNSQQVAAALGTIGPPSLLHQQALTRILQDNNRRAGGVLGSALAHAWAEQYPAAPEARRLAARARGLHTIYHDLLPSVQQTPLAQQFAWFRTPRVRATGDRVIIPENYAAILAAQQAGGYFLEYRAGEENHNEFLLPERVAPSQLRIGVDLGSVITPGTIHVSYDNQPAREIRVLGEQVIPAAQWRPGRAVAALAVLDHRHRTRGLTLGGPFAAQRVAAPLLDAGVIELPLPRDTQRIRVWRDGAQTVPLRIAVQYRASKYFAMAEAGYLGLLQALGPDAVYESLQAALSRGDATGSAGRDAMAVAAQHGRAEQEDVAHDLYNQWLPLLRLLFSRHDSFVAAGQLPADTADPARTLEASQIKSLRREALQAAEQGDWVASLEIWSDIWRGTTGAVRDQAAMARVAALEQLGESYLAEQQLRLYSIGTENAALREQALARLLVRYQRAGDDQATLTLLATAAIRQPDAARLRELANTLLDLGYTRFALQVALALPAAEQPEELLLRASYAAGWWQLFEAVLARVDSTQQRRWWQGLRAQKSGDYRTALAHWVAAGAVASPQREQLERGLQIRAQLAASEYRLRREAVLDWENWQARYPGRHRWQNAPQLVTRHAGGARLYLTEQDQTRQGFRAAPGTPVTVRAYGPVRLRFSVRPLHPATASGEVDDWVIVRDAKRHKVFPVTGNTPAQGLQLIGQDQFLPGRSAIFEYQVEAGLHEISISPERGPMLMQVAAWRPALPLTVLPALNPETAQAALNGMLGEADDRPLQLPEGAAIEVVRECGSLMNIPGSELVVLQPAGDAAGTPQQTWMSGLTGPWRRTPAARVSLPESPAAVPQYHEVSSGQTLYAIARQYRMHYRQLAAENAIEVPYAIKPGQRLRIRPGADTVPAHTARRNTPDSHRVSAGQTLYAIARQYGMDYRHLAADNGIEAPYAIKPGQRLRIASGTSPVLVPVAAGDAREYHLVSTGETLYGIARQYGMDYRYLATLNGIQPPWQIRVGQHVRIKPVAKPVIAPVDASAALDYHMVISGETLYSIARQYGQDYQQLATLNGITPPYKINLGQRLRIKLGQRLPIEPLTPPVITHEDARDMLDDHRVTAGETLYSIARQYGQDYRRIAALNGITPPYAIKPGQHLRIESVDEDEMVSHRMRNILWVAEHDAELVPAMLAEGEELFQQYPGVPGLQRMVRRLRRAVSWELVQGVQHSGGVRKVQLSGWQPEHPPTRVRKALLRPLGPGEQLLSGFDTLVLAAAQPDTSRFSMELAVEELITAPLQPMKVAVRLDDLQERSVLLTPETPRQTLTQLIPGGSHLLRVRITDPVVSQFLRVYIREQDGANDESLMARPTSRTYHIATRTEPVVLYLEGPSRLRIDELRNGRTHNSYRNLAPGWQKVQLDAAPGQEEALYRIYRRTLAQQQPRVPARNLKRNLNAVPAPIGQLFRTASSPRIATPEWLPLGGQEDGTWTLAGSLVSRRNLDEDEDEVEDSERFAEFRATHRYHAAHLDSYFRTDLFTRAREFGGPTVGLREWINIQRDNWPVTIDLRAALFGQRPDAMTGHEWALTLQTAFSRRFELNAKTSHRPRLKLFRRWLSLDENPSARPLRVDQDIFTQYKSDHLQGLELGDTLGYRPWLDTEIYTGFAAVSNEDLNPFDPDHMRLSIGARQLLGDWQAGMEFMHTDYFRDEDRRSENHRSRLRLQLDWLGWQSAQHGWRTRLQLDRDQGSGDVSARLSIAWNRANGRFFRDYRTADTGFLSLRRRRLVDQGLLMAGGRAQ